MTNHVFDDGNQPSNDAMQTTDVNSSVEHTRRKLIAKLAAGAFAVPAVLASISGSSASASN